MKDEQQYWQEVLKRIVAVLVAVQDFTPPPRNQDHIPPPQPRGETILNTWWGKRVDKLPGSPGAVLGVLRGHKVCFVWR